MVYDRKPDCHPVSRAWMRSHVPDLTTERSFDLQVRWLFMCLAYLLTCHVCTTRHWQKSGRLVQELNMCTVVNADFQVLS